MGRKKMFTERMVAPFHHGTFDIIDRARGKQNRTDFLRSATYAYLGSLGYSDDVAIIVSGALNDRLRKKAHAVRAG